MLSPPTAWLSNGYADSEILTLDEGIQSIFEMKTKLKGHQLLTKQPNFVIRTQTTFTIFSRDTMDRFQSHLSWTEGWQGPSVNKCVPLSTLEAQGRSTARTLSMKR